MSFEENVDSGSAKLNSRDWSEKLGVVVVDPDGWDRSDFDQSWAELITEEEFRTRLQCSTSMQRAKSKSPR